jgi:hypothetical protein
MCDYPADMTDAIPPHVDAELWVTAEGYDGRLFLLGNAHSHPGRMSAWSEALQIETGISKSDITGASAAARRWIEGFLSGSEPGPAEYLGIDALAESDLSDDDPGYERWRAALAEYRAVGSMPHLSRVPTVPFSADARLDHVPWVFAGGQVWVWQGNVWAVADPQPAVDRGVLAGSLCATRGFHEMTGGDERHYCCIDCGLAEEAVG